MAYSIPFFRNTATPDDETLDFPSGSSDEEQTGIQSTPPPMAMSGMSERRRRRRRAVAQVVRVRPPRDGLQASNAASLAQKAGMAGSQPLVS